MVVCLGATVTWFPVVLLGPWRNSNGKPKSSVSCPFPIPLIFLFSVFNPNVGKYETEKFRIQTLFTQWLLLEKTANLELWENTTLLILCFWELTMELFNSIKSKGNKAASTKVTIKKFGSSYKGE